MNATILALTTMLVLSAMASSALRTIRDSRSWDRVNAVDTRARYLAVTALRRAAESDFKNTSPVFFKTGDVRLRKRDTTVICDVRINGERRTIESKWEKEGGRWRARAWKE